VYDTFREKLPQHFATKDVWMKEVGAALPKNGTSAWNTWKACLTWMQNHAVIAWLDALPANPSSLSSGSNMTQVLATALGALHTHEMKETPEDEVVVVEEGGGDVVVEEGGAGAKTGGEVQQDAVGDSAKKRKVRVSFKAKGPDGIPGWTPLFWLVFVLTGPVQGMKGGLVWEEWKQAEQAGPSHVAGEGLGISTKDGSKGRKVQKIDDKVEQVREHQANKVTQGSEALISIAHSMVVISKTCRSGGGLTLKELRVKADAAKELVSLRAILTQI